MNSPTSKRVAFETARLSLARHVISGEQAHHQAVAHATAVSASALKMERVGLWYFDENDEHLICRCMYTASTKSFSSGQLLDATIYPTYVAALRERRAIAAGDARQHRLTQELSETYLVPNKIGALLDAPIIMEGKVIGVVCHEHVGGVREFEQHEIDFAGSVADMVAMIEEQSSRLRVEAALREQDERIQRAAKLEALGRLARTAAHDFNNVLTTIIGTAEQLLRSADESVRDKAARVVDAAEMGGRIAHELLVLGRDGPASLRPVGLSEAIGSVATVLRSRFGPPLHVISHIHIDNPVVQADPTQIERILLNLGINAAEASGGKGQIEFHVREPKSDEARGRGWLALEVVDHGIGMSDDVKAHLFEPYFTTKPSGTGLGLASVYGIVRQLKGRVHAESNHGEGTKFVVVLPRMV